MKRKSGVRAGLFLLLSAAMAVSLAGCSGKGKNQGQQTDPSAPIQVGIIVSDDSYARMETKDKEQILVGKEPEIVKELAEALERQVTFKEAANEEELLSLLNQGEIEIAAGRLCWKDSYEEAYIHSSSYGKSGLYLVTRRYDYSDMLSGYENQPVGVSKNISEASLIKVTGLEKTVQTGYENMETAVSDLTSGRQKAILCTEREAVKIAESSREVQVQELAFGPREDHYFLLLPGNEIMASNVSVIIGRYLDRQADGFLQETPAEESEGSSQAKAEPDSQRSLVRG